MLKMFVLISQRKKQERKRMRRKDKTDVLKAEISKNLQMCLVVMNYHKHKHTHYTPTHHHTNEARIVYTMIPYIYYILLSYNLSKCHGDLRPKLCTFIFIWKTVEPGKIYLNSSQSLQLPSRYIANIGIHKVRFHWEKKIINVPPLHSSTINIVS